ncbi:MAG: hypothetical protein AB7H90_03485 [Alphaproteobacteria bacterium]
MAETENDIFLQIQEVGPDGIIAGAGWDEIIIGGDYTIVGTELTTTGVRVELPDDGFFAVKAQLFFGGYDFGTSHPQWRIFQEGPDIALATADPTPSAGSTGGETIIVPKTGILAAGTKIVIHVQSGDVDDDGIFEVQYPSYMHVVWWPPVT